MSSGLDSITLDDKITYLMKKTGNIPSTNSDLHSYNEPGISARQKVFFQQVYREELPKTAPDSGWVDVNGLEISLNQLGDGQVATHSTQPLAYYKKWPTASVIEGRDQSFIATPETANPLQQAIPHNFDPLGSYETTLYFGGSNSHIRIEPGFGEWMVDIDSGILTFYKYEDVKTLVSEQTPPYISFFTYTGDVGVPAPSPWVRLPDGLSYSESPVLINQTTSSGDFKLEVNGNSKFDGVVEAEDICVVSDQRLKTNIMPISNPVDRLSKLRGVSFSWKHGKRSSFGIVAQELESCLPGSTRVTADGTLAANYNSVIAMLVECVKQQSKQIRDLRSKLELHIAS